MRRRYRGVLRHGGSEARFDLVAPPRGENAQVRLEGVAVSATPDTTVGIFYFSWCCVSCRQRVPVLVLVRVR